MGLQSPPTFSEWSVGESLPLKRPWESVASFTANANPMPEEQPVMRTVLGAMGAQQEPGLVLAFAPCPTLCLPAGFFSSPNKGRF